MHHGLQRVSVTIIVTDEEWADLWQRSEGTGWPVPQFIRKLLGFEVRQFSNPHTFERDREEDDAWERLQRMGLDPKVYFPGE